MAFDKNFRHLSEDELEAVEGAISLAWKRFLKTGMMNAKNKAEAQQIIAQRIISSALDGEFDPWILAREAIFHMWQLKFVDEPLVRLASRKRRRRMLD
jgi:hypothetical protein